MLKSMTGFGKGSASNDIATITVELKSVNHRYLDLGIKMPRKLNFLEGFIRNRIAEDVKRGKVDVYINMTEHADAAVTLSLNMNLAHMYYDLFEQLEKELNIPNDLRTSTLARIPDIIEQTENEGDEEALKALVKEALDKALVMFIENRTSEGGRIEADLRGKLDEMDALVDELVRRSPQIIEEYKTRINNKLTELLEGTGIDETRIAQEVIIYADKVCIDEEMVRLKSHVVEARKVFDTADEVGRKMDFLAQEMNREANTVLSKSTDAEIADIGITLKTLIEKIREQIQNLE